MKKRFNYVMLLILIGLALCLTSCSKIKKVELAPTENDALAIENLEDYSYYIEKKYGDKDGNMSFAEAQDALDEYYQEALAAKENGIYDYVEQNDTCVYVRLESGRGFIFAPSIEGIQAGGDDVELSILSFDTNYSENIAQNIMNACDYMEEYIEGFQSEGYTCQGVSYKDHEVTIEVLKKLIDPGRKIIIFNTHGGETPYGTHILSGVKWEKNLDLLTDEVLKKISLEGFKELGYGWWPNGEDDEGVADFMKRLLNGVSKESIVTNQKGNLYLGPKFFELLSEENYLEGSLVILGACNSTKDYKKNPECSLVGTMLGKGAEVVIGFDEPVRKEYCNRLIKDFMKSLVGLEEDFYSPVDLIGRGEINTFSDAFHHAVLEAESIDTYFKYTCKESALAELEYGGLESVSYAEKLKHTIDNLKDVEAKHEEEELSYLEWSSPYTNDYIEEDGKNYTCRAEIYGNTNLTLEDLLKETDEASNEDGDATGWVVEPTDEYSDIEQLETTEGRGVKGRNNEEYLYCIMNKDGYPQQWYEGVIPDSEGGTINYSPDAVAVRKSGQSAWDNWGIIDYNGRILLEPTISSETQSPNPFVGISKGYSGIGYSKYTGGPGSGTTVYLLNDNYSEFAFSFEYPDGGGVPNANHFVRNGKLYRQELQSVSEVVVPNQLRGALVPEYVDEGRYYGVGDDYIYVTDSGELLSQGAYYKKNYVNGYYVGLPEYADGAISPTQKFAIVNASTGKPITDFKYYDALYFEEGLCPVARLDGDDTKWGFIDESGKEVTDFIFDKVSTMYDGKVAVIYDGKFGILNLEKALEKGFLDRAALDSLSAQATTTSQTT